MKRVTILSLFIVLFVFLVGALAVQAQGKPDGVATHIIVFRSDVNARAAALELASAHGLGVTNIYSHALQGMAAVVPQGRLNALSKDPRVAYVEENREVSISAQEIPTGIQRMFATSNSLLAINGSDDVRVDVDVAVIDTGIDLQHPDLNVQGGVDCTGGGPMNQTCVAGGDDNHYHGTHVAGTIGAIDNGDYVVGVAPGARLWAVKVLNQRGSGYTNWIVAGIDWVAANAATIEVANMSLGGSGFSQAEYDAIQGAVNAGVAFAVAAGNDSDDASKYSPAAFDNVLTVSALADSDGAPGGTWDPLACRTDQEDTLADFSNFGSSVDIAAPGVCITSTYPLEQGGLGTISGTSMASPHAAGALAVLASTNNPNNAADVYALYQQLINSGNCDWTDDSGDGVKESLLDIHNFAANPALVDGRCSGGGGTPPPPTGATVHLGNLQGTATAKGPKNWQAGATATVHDSSHAAVSGASVTISASGAVSGTATCTTGSAGTCSVVTGNIPNGTSVTFTVTDISLSGSSYDSGANDVGTSVTVSH